MIPHAWLHQLRNEGRVELNPTGARAHEEAEHGVPVVVAAAEDPSAVAAIHGDDGVAAAIRAPRRPLDPGAHGELGRNENGRGGQAHDVVHAVEDERVGVLEGDRGRPVGGVDRPVHQRAGIAVPGRVQCIGAAALVKGPAPDHVGRVRLSLYDKGAGVARRRGSKAQAVRAGCQGLEEVEAVGLGGAEDRRLPWRGEGHTDAADAHLVGIALAVLVGIHEDVAADR